MSGRQEWRPYKTWRVSVGTAFLPSAQAPLKKRKNDSFGYIILAKSGLMNMVQAETVLENAPQTLQSTLTFDEYLKVYNSVEGMRTEWTPNGVESYTMSNNVRHQDIIQFLLILFNFFLSRRSMGRVLLAGIPMRISDAQPAREPDLLVVLTAHLDRIKPTYLDGIADIVIEIVSPESDARDHGDKFIEYEAAGVPEYWLIDPTRREADVYALGEDQRYHRLNRTAQGQVTSAVLAGFALDPALLWTETLPGGAAVLALVEGMNA